MLLQHSRDIYVGMYDFAVSGGAIGAINLQVTVPPNTVVTEFGVFVVTAPLSGGLATIAFNTIDTSVSPAVTTVGRLLPATAIAVLAVNTVVYGIIPGAAAPNEPFKLPNPFSIGMSIAAFVLTAGKIQFFAKGITYDF